MSDFVTRLAERAMGTAPVVQPLIPPVFAPEPGMEPAPDDPDQTTRQIRETRWDAPVPDDAAATPNEERDTGVALPSRVPDGSTRNPRPRTGPEPSRDGPSSGQGDRDAAPAPRRRPRDAGVSGPPETGMVPEQEDRQNPSSVVPVARPSGSRPLHSSEPSERETMPEGSPQGPAPTTIAGGPAPPPELRFGPARRVEPVPARRSIDQTPPRLVPGGEPSGSSASEDGPGQAMLRTTARTQRSRLAARAPAPPPGSQSVPTRGVTPGDVPVIVPGIVQPDRRQERDPREPHVPAPTIRVAIGRIEVRAITPPPAPPARQETPARPGPLLSLDDYLKRRNGGQP